MTTPSKKPRDLTPRQRRFVQELPLARTPTEAAIKAGYSNASEAAHVRAAELVRHSTVGLAIQAQHQAATSEKVMSQLKRKERLSELAIPDPEHPDPVDAIRELNRMERVYDDRAPVGDTYNTVVLAGYSLADLELMLAAMKARADEKAASLSGRKSSGAKERV